MRVLLIEDHKPLLRALRQGLEEEGFAVDVAADGEEVAAGDTIVVLEAMKMEQPLTAHKAGTVTGLSISVGQTVPAGAVICQLR